MLSAGAVIADRFIVEKVLGEGGIARVYRVRHRQLGTVHALKVLTLQREKMSERLLLEGRIQARMRHPNIVAVTDVLAVDGRPALLMEFVDGASMEGWLMSGPEIYLEDGLALFSQILAGVHAAHLQGVLHRDLKPANVLLAAGPAGVIAKVSDFGIAKVAVEEQKSGLTATGVPMGTPGYMAPEQFTDSAAADARSDIFALGVMLYELVTGRQPFLQGDLLKILNATATGSYVPTDQLVPDLPAHLVDAITRALSPEPEDRFPDCASMGRAVFAEHGNLLEAALAPTGAPTPLRLDGIAATSTMMMPSLTDELSASTGEFSASTAVPTPSMQQQAPTFGGPAPSTVQSPVAAPAAPAAPSTQSAPAPVGSGVPLEEDKSGLPIGLIAAAVGLLLTLGIGGFWLSTTDSGNAGEGAIATEGARGTAAADASADAADARTADVDRAARATEGAAADDGANPGGDAGDPTGDEASADGANDGADGPNDGATANSDDASGTQIDGATANSDDAAGTQIDGADVAAPDGENADDATDGDAVVETADDTTDDGTTDDGTDEGAPDEGEPAGSDDAVADAEPPPEAAPSYPSLSGTWRGVANRRPMVLRLNSSGDGAVSGEIVFTGGTSARSIPLAGRVDEAGNLSLQEPGGQGLQLSGSLAGSSLSGAYLRAGQKKSLVWNATRE